MGLHLSSAPFAAHAVQTAALQPSGAPWRSFKAGGYWRRPSPDGTIIGPDPAGQSRTPAGKTAS